MPPGTTQREFELWLHAQATLDAWHQAAADGDSARYFDLMTDDAVFLGTDASERWSLEEFKAYAAPHFDRPAQPGSEGPYRPAWIYNPVERHVRLSKGGRTAWADERLDNPSYGAARGTGVLLHDSRLGWRIAHYSLTFTVPNAIARDITDRIKAHDAARVEGQAPPTTP